MRTTVLIFARYPQPGKVKTRMTPPLTPEEAAELHLASLRTVCESLQACRDLTSVLIVTPDERANDLAAMLADHVAESWAQGDGSLGERLCRTTDRAFEAGADAVLMIGADSPTLPVRLVRNALTALTSHEAVLGPTHDGGYYLLGLRGPIPLLFDRIDWGTDRVAEQTRQRALEVGVVLAEVRSWYDLDRFDDLRPALEDLSATDEPLGSAAASLERLINSLLEKYPDG
ncbi:MAG: TIGR04282 family arsenosugar biosynthesis glycosyltransferase [Planctomycetes bacterium]|nr:TIGR04282 family arsenosugar biosynthesis glycosyltransferase [Planctomycetota bacterium]